MTAVDAGSDGDDTNAHLRGSTPSGGARGRPGALWRPAVAGLLLTGGRSTRMGRDKATMLLPDGATWAERAARLLAGVSAPAIEVGPGVSGLLAVPDDEPGGGPLLAVIAGWRRLCALGGELPTIVLACDLPRLPGEVLTRLASFTGRESVVPVIDGRPQWCCGRYSPSCLHGAAALAAAGRRDLKALGEAANGSLRLVDPIELGAPAASLADADGPGDLAALGLAASPDEEAAPGLPATGGGLLGALARSTAELGVELGPLGFGTLPA